MENLTGSEIVLKALSDQGVEVVLVILEEQCYLYMIVYLNKIQLNIFLFVKKQELYTLLKVMQSHLEKLELLLVTSGPGATNIVTGLTDAIMDSVPIVCITGQVPSHLIGSDAFQECDTTGITRPCTKHNYLVKDVNKLSATFHEAFIIAKNGKPGPVLIDIPKDVQFAKGKYLGPKEISIQSHRLFDPRIKGNDKQIEEATKLIS